MQRDYTVGAVVLPDANVLQLTVDGPSATMATALANSIGQNAIDYINTLYEVFTLSVIDPATVPTEPFSPQPLRDAGVAAVLGLVVGAVLAIVREQLRMTLGSLVEQRALDSESQAYERRHFERLLDRVAARSTGVLSLGIIQLDGLAALQETLPRATMQSALRHVTGVLKNELRGNDLVGRWDQAQFAVLLPGTAGPAAARVLERIQGILCEPVPLEGGESVSLEPRIGVGVRQADESAPRVVERAQQALGQACRDRAQSVFVSPWRTG
jgi:diguanylate cyclase (GGDEF)-like protein